MMAMSGGTALCALDPIRTSRFKRHGLLLIAFARANAIHQSVDRLVGLGRPGRDSDERFRNGTEPKVLAAACLHRLLKRQRQVGHDRSSGRSKLTQRPDDDPQPPFIAVSAKRLGQCSHGSLGVFRVRCHFPERTRRHPRGVVQNPRQVEGFGFVGP